MIRQLIRLRERNQITLPAEIAEKLGVEPGALLELILSPEGDHVELRHAQVVRAGTARAERELKWAKDDIKEGRFTTFASPAEMAADLKKRREQEEGGRFQEQIEDLRKQLQSLEMNVLRMGNFGETVR